MKGLVLIISCLLSYSAISEEFKTGDRVFVKRNIDSKLEGDPFESGAAICDVYKYITKKNPIRESLALKFSYSGKIIALVNCVAYDKWINVEQVESIGGIGPAPYYAPDNIVQKLK